MCGINLIIDKDNTKSIDDSIIGAMAKRTRHRGPDETILKTIKSPSRNYYLAANRLKITDQSDFSSQPFIGPDRRFALLFNGEIYNFYALKNELLGMGVQFSSSSDTEVLFHWLRLIGPDGIQKLDGMFTFVFIDFEKDHILMARDRFGIKPLYFYYDDRYLIVSSEIQAIANTGLFPKKINDSQIHHYLLFKYVKSPETIFQDVVELEPGKRLMLNDRGLDIESFVQTNKNEESSSPSISEIENLIRDSLLQQLNAPVPVGLLLSGGVDSTLLLAFAKEEGFTMPTFSIVNQKADKSFGTEDYKFARKAAQLYGSLHHETTIDISILNHFDRYVKEMDQPIGDSSYLMTSEVCKQASASNNDLQAGIKVLLSGAGADEVFGGYNRHLAFYRYLKYYNILNSTLPLSRPLSILLPTGFPHPFRKKFQLIKKFLGSIERSPENTFRNFLMFTELDTEKNRIQDHHSIKSDWMAWALEHDLKNYLVGDVLALSDKAAMLHSIELRVPYLDEKLVKYMKGLSAEAILKHGRKWILKDLLGKHGGKAFADRPKEGFGLPLSNWLMDKSLGHLWGFMGKKDHIIFRYLDKNLVARLIAEQKSKKEDHGPLLWSVLTLAHWLEHNFT